MASVKVIWIVYIYLTIASGQILRQYSNKTLANQGICKGTSNVTSSRKFYDYYKDCIVVLGSVKFALMETAKPEHFVNISLPNLREVTEFFVAYRVANLTDLSLVFPNLARIRGQKLLNNYGLIIHDMQDLEMIGLHGLFKIDRGGVMIWGAPNACFITSVDWETIAPRSRIVITPEEKQAHCNFTCTCTCDEYNRCWSNKKCQIYLEGPEADNCHEQCLGCRKTRYDECTLCRHYTHNGKCVSTCPPNTIILPDVSYCITNEECDNLDGWVWNYKCVFHCPVKYEEIKSATGTTCKYCPDCDSICPGLVVESIMSAQEAEKCVFVNGSLEIHLKPVQGLMRDLRIYLSRIEEVSDYVVIYSTETITSLDFLSSLKRIKGRNLKGDTYSLIINDMASLQSLFTPNVTKNLTIDRGKLHMHSNPMLCMKEIQKIMPLFPVQPNDTDIPIGTNGYSGGCEDAVTFEVNIIKGTTAVVLFSAIPDPDAHYSVLYARLPAITKGKLVPEFCSNLEWYAMNVETIFEQDTGVVELTTLRPASTYAICVETYDPVSRKLARSAVINITTPVGKPEPPFIVELVANSTTVSTTGVDIYWVDHKQYLSHISHYELDVSLLEIDIKDIIVKNQCTYYHYYQYTKIEKALHRVVLNPPPEYAKDCEAMCTKAATDEHYDVCSIIGCDNLEDEVLGNTKIGRHVRTLVMKLGKKNKHTRIDGLAPFRDYRFRLRACADKECSRSARGVVRTLPLKSADVPSIISVDTNEHGHISVKWAPPELTNGPILSFTVEFMPKTKEPIRELLWWCALANETSLTVKNVTVDTYVRVCTRSMGSNMVCAKWISVEKTYVIPLWTGIVFAVFLYMGSVIIAGAMRNKRSDTMDLLPLVDSSAELTNDSEPPTRMFSDFVPIYAIPLRDTQL